ncbi:MAG: hypothetical protein Q9181_000827 [Wetmoreana brouardii]
MATCDMPDDDELPNNLEETPDHAHTLDPVDMLEADIVAADRRLRPYDLSLEKLDAAYNAVMRYAGYLASIYRSKDAELIAAKAIETYGNVDPNQGPPTQQDNEHQPTVGNGPSQQLPVQQIPVQQLPVQQLPVQQLPVQQLPVQQLPVQQLPAQQISTDQQVEPPIPLPDLPEHVWLALEGKPYDPFWMETYGISEEFLSSWNSKKKVEELFRQGALRLGDLLYFEVTSSTDVQETRCVVVRDCDRSSGIRVEIVNSITGHPTGVTETCLGISALHQFVIAHFADKCSLCKPRSSKAYDVTYVMRNDQKLGALTLFRQRFALWQIMQMRRGTIKKSQRGGKLFAGINVNKPKEPEAS